MCIPGKVVAVSNNNTRENALHYAERKSISDLPPIYASDTNEVSYSGVGTIVEIDESLFGKQKFGRGELHDGQWVFGGVQRGTGECFLVSVERRDAETLVPLIVKHVVPGTTIYSDKWKAYSRLG